METIVDHVNCTEGQPEYCTEVLSTNHVHYSPAIKYIEIVLSIIIFLGGFSCTLLVIILLVKYRLTAVCHLYIKNLAVNDALYLATIPIQVIAYATGDWRLGLTMCKLHSVAVQLPRLLSAFFITAFCLDLHLSVSQRNDLENYRSVTYKVVTVFISFSAVCYCLVIIIFTELLPYDRNNSSLTCLIFPELSAGFNKKYIPVVFILYVIPLVTSWGYFIKASMTFPINSFSDPATREIFQLTRALLILFTICHFLFWLVSTIHDLVATPLMIIANVSVAINAAVNPIFFIKYNKDLRQKVPTIKRRETISSGETMVIGNL